MRVSEDVVFFTRLEADAGYEVTLRLESRATLIMDESMSASNYATNCDGTTASAAENIDDAESDDVLIIDGLANRFQLPGWHVSWILGSEEHIKAIASRGSSLDDDASVAFQESCIPMLEPYRVIEETRALQKHFTASGISGTM
jgi:aspartate/methionine/tyrosine aminotransferase